MASRLVFSAGRHTYSLDGKRVPGVTSVIRKATDKPALVNAAAREAALWAAAHVDGLPVLGADAWVREASGAPRRAWSKAADRGHLLHEAAAQLINGDALEPVDKATGEEWPDDVIRSAGQLARFMDEWDAFPLLAEAPVYHDADRWAGTLDLVADLRDGRRWLIDYKTGATGIYPETALQLAAYRHATHVQWNGPDGLEDRAMLPVHECAALWVRPDGYELRPVLADADTYECFRHMLPVAEWVARPREASVFDPLPVP